MGPMGEAKLPSVTTAGPNILAMGFRYDSLTIKAPIYYRTLL